MTEEPIIIRMNIAHYGAMLKLDLDHQQRSTVKRLLTEAEEDLVLATNLNIRQSCLTAGTRATLP